jgi:hypothetical protein
MIFPDNGSFKFNAAMADNPAPMSQGRSREAAGFNSGRGRWHDVAV